MTSVSDGRLLNRGGWGNGEVYLTEAGGEALVVKTYAGKPGVIRLLGRWLIAREKRAYRALRGVRGVPALRPSDDPLSLTVEHVRSRWIDQALADGDGAAIIASLAELIGRMHQRGVYHLDLRNRGNVLIDPEQRAHVVDFASAVIVGGGTGGRYLGRLLARVDRAALAKWAARAGLAS